MKYLTLDADIPDSQQEMYNIRELEFDELIASGAVPEMISDQALVDQINESSLKHASEIINEVNNTELNDYVIKSNADMKKDILNMVHEQSEDNLSKFFIMIIKYRGNIRKAFHIIKM